MKDFLAAQAEKVKGFLAELRHVVDLAEPGEPDVQVDNLL